MVLDTLVRLGEIGLFIAAASLSEESDTVERELESFSRVDPSILLLCDRRLIGRDSTLEA
jgi:hypothetical protein